MPPAAIETRFALSQQAWGGFDLHRVRRLAQVAQFGLKAGVDSAEDAMPMTHKELEEGQVLALDFTKLAKVAGCGEDLIPAIAQDCETGEVLIVGYANQLALDTARREGMATFWSSSRNELWIKGKTSGDFLEIVEIRVNCEQNSLLYLVRPKGKGACHTKGADGNARSGCYYRRLTPEGRLEFVQGKA